MYKETAKRAAMRIAFVLFSIALGFLLVAVTVYIGSLMFPYEFSWLLVLGCYLILCILKMLIG